MWIRFLLLINIIFLSFFSSAAEIYTVKSVKVVASNKSASIARNIAIENGQIKAFHILVKQHFPDAAGEIGNISNESILNTVAGFEISNEKKSATNYLATLNVKFNKLQLDKLMKNLGVEAKFSEKEMPPENKVTENSLPQAVTSPTLNSLIIPVYENQAKLQWIDEDNNPWHNYLNSKISGLLTKNPKFTLPVGDIEDLSIINKNILNRNIIDLDQLMEKYNVNNILLSKLFSVQEDSQVHYELQLNYINKFNPKWQQHNIDNLSGEEVVEIMKIAYEAIENYDYSKTYTKIKQNFNLTSIHNIIIDFNIDLISDWIHLEKILKESEYIENIKLRNMNLNKYKFSIDYKISYLDLVAFFNNNNYELTEEQNSNYKLSKVNLNAEY